MTKAINREHSDFPTDPESMTYATEYNAGLEGKFQWCLRKDHTEAWVMGYLDGLGDSGYYTYAEIWKEFWDAGIRPSAASVVEKVSIRKENGNG